jgi:hypothetical protein
MIDALVAGQTQPDAAAVAGVSRTTVQRWLHLPAIRQALHEAQAAAVAEAARAAVGRMRAAVETIEGVMSDTDVPAHVRLSAARELLAAGGRLYELAVISERLARLEERFEVKRDEYPTN